jgi:hypothetical protein
MPSRNEKAALCRRYCDRGLQEAITNPFIFPGNRLHKMRGFLNHVFSSSADEKPKKKEKKITPTNVSERESKKVISFLQYPRAAIGHIRSHINSI